MELLCRFNLKHLNKWKLFSINSEHFWDEKSHYATVIETTIWVFTSIEISGVPRLLRLGSITLLSGFDSLIELILVFIRLTFYVNKSQKISNTCTNELFNCTILNAKVLVEYIAYRPLSSHFTLALITPEYIGVSL